MSSIVLIASYADSLVKFRGPLIDAFLDAGLQVHVAVPCLDESQEINQQILSKGVKVHRYPLQRAGVNPFADVLSMFYLVRLLREIKPMYVLPYTIKPVIYGSLAAWLLSVPRRFALITGLGYAFTGQMNGRRPWLLKLIKVLYRFSMTRTGYVFFQNPDDEALFRKLGLLPPSIPSCVVNGSGVDVSEYSVVPMPAKPSFLLIARLLGDKGVREYVQAAAIVKQCYPEACFQMVGWIDDNPDAISQAELDAWVDAGTIEFLGKLSDVRPAIANSSVYVLPSYREGTPRTVLEAMAMGRAVITTDAPGCRETVVDGFNGFLVPVRDVSALEGAMKKMIENPEVVASMGARSRQIAEEKYDVHQVNAVMLGEMGLR